MSKISQFIKKYLAILLLFILVKPAFSDSSTAFPQISPTESPPSDFAVVYPAFNLNAPNQDIIELLLVDSKTGSFQKHSYYIPRSTDNSNIAKVKLFTDPSSKKIWIGYIRQDQLWGRELHIMEIADYNSPQRVKSYNPISVTSSFNLKDYACTVESTSADLVCVITNNNIVPYVYQTDIYWLRLTSTGNVQFNSALSIPLTSLLIPPVTNGASLEISYNTVQNSALSGTFDVSLNLVELCSSLICPIYNYHFKMDSYGNSITGLEKVLGPLPQPEEKSLSTTDLTLCAPTSLFGLLAPTAYAAALDAAMPQWNQYMLPLPANSNVALGGLVPFLDSTTGKITAAVSLLAWGPNFLKSPGATLQFYISAPPFSAWYPYVIIKRPSSESFQTLVMPNRTHSTSPTSFTIAAITGIQGSRTEKIKIFTNRNGGNFREYELVTFNNTAGSAYFVNYSLSAQWLGR